MKAELAFEPDPSLQSLFRLTPESLARHLDAAQLFGSAKTAALSARMAAEQWPHLTRQLGEHLCGFLQDNFADILLEAWGKFRELHEQATRTREDPDLSSDVALADHTFVYEADPHVDVLVDGVVLTRMPFSIQLVCEIDGLLLSLRHGCVASVRSGHAKCMLELRCSGHPLWEHRLSQLDLPVLIRLKHPVPLTRRPLPPPAPVAQAATGRSGHVSIG